MRQTKNAVCRRSSLAYATSLANAHSAWGQTLKCRANSAVLFNKCELQFTSAQFASTISIKLSRHQSSSTHCCMPWKARFSMFKSEPPRTAWIYVRHLSLIHQPELWNKSRKAKSPSLPAKAHTGRRANNDMDILPSQCSMHQQRWKIWYL